MDFYLVTNKSLTDNIKEFEKIKWRLDGTYLYYKEITGNKIPNVDNHYNMLIVYESDKFDDLCQKLGIVFKKISIDIDDYNKYYIDEYKDMESLNESVLNTFDDLEHFFNAIAVSGKKLFLTDKYSYTLDNNKINKISTWVKAKGVSEIVFVVPNSCFAQMNRNNIVSDFNSLGITINHIDRNIHGRYWIIDNKGFLADASSNTNGYFVAMILPSNDVADLKNAYNF